MEQRYKKAADWGLIADVAERTGVPVIGARGLVGAARFASASCFCAPLGNRSRRRFSTHTPKHTRNAHHNAHHHHAPARTGNGDVLTHYEAADRWAAGRGALTAIMVGRGALVKPWLFAEVRQGRELCLDARQRIGEYR